MTPGTGRRSAWIALFLAWTLPLATPLRAQDPAPSTDGAAALREALAAIGPGRALRIDAARGWEIEGRFAGVDGEVLTLREADEERILLADVRRVWVREPAPKRGAVIGGAVAGALGVAVGYVLAYGLCDAADCGAWNDDSAEAMAVMGAVGAAGGAGVGALMGQWIGRWERRWPPDP